MGSRPRELRRAERRRGLFPWPVAVPPEWSSALILLAEARRRRTIVRPGQECGIPTGHLSYVRSNRSVLRGWAGSAGRAATATGPGRRCREPAVATAVLPRWARAAAARPSSTLRCSPATLVRDGYSAAKRPHVVAAGSGQGPNQAARSPSPSRSTVRRNAGCPQREKVPPPAAGGGGGGGGGGGKSDYRRKLVSFVFQVQPGKASRRRQFTQGPGVRQLTWQGGVLRCPHPLMLVRSARRTLNSCRVDKGV
ncbi:hypothetical protein SAMN05216215_1010154 [Saccharopolyspora shandongensis]|uniref:Uncharacterized protein n=1 Tax=Saccharopolyspora shandongensis TaxID=418495 RepID=A0A1H3BFR8_9PSEU|nr:hypothetical protein SAMN05216215_1010154 [Saccharopolyspora shandongensis]